jgi:hypothetical protein
MTGSDFPDCTNEREGYVVNLENDNAKSNLRAAFNRISADNNVVFFFSGPLYADINGERMNCS